MRNPPCSLAAVCLLVVHQLPTLEAQSAPGLEQALILPSGVMVCRTEVREIPEGVVRSTEMVEVDPTTSEELRHIELTADSSGTPTFLLIVVALPDSGEGLSVTVQFTPDLRGTILHIRENAAQSGGFQVLSRRKLGEQELARARVLAQSIVAGGCFRGTTLKPAS